MSQPESFEEFSEAAAASMPPDALAALNDKLSDAIRLKEMVDQMEDDLSAAKKQLNNLNTVVLPDMMAEMGIDEITQRGWRVKVGEFVSGTLPKEPEKREAAIAWLEANEAGDLIKTDLSVQFGKSQHNLAVDLFERIKKEGFHPTLASGVHPQTLAAYARDRMRNGEPLDTELLGLFTGRVVKYSKV